MHDARLSPETARTFLARLGEHIERNVNIIDGDGIIVASRDASRVGQYHEAAHRLIRSGGEIEAVERREGMPPGIREGVNLPIRRGDETLGVVGVTGIPAEIMDLAYAVKTSVEAMAELELAKDRLLKRQAGRTLLVNRLIRQDDGDSLSAAGLAVKLGYDPAAWRAPVLVALEEGRDAEELWSELKSRNLREPQDFGASTPEGDLLVFKSLKLPARGILSAYEDELERFAAGLGIVDGGIRCFAGMFQKDMNLYPQAYRQALWLRTRYAGKPGGGMTTIPRRMEAYLLSRVPRREFSALTAALGDALPELSSPPVTETLRALRKRDFNLKESAGDLGVHRNTMTARIERLETLLGTDPRTDEGARQLCRLLAFGVEPGNAFEGSDT